MRWLSQSGCAPKNIATPAQRAARPRPTPIEAVDGRRRRLRRRHAGRAAERSAQPAPLGAARRRGAAPARSRHALLRRRPRRDGPGLPARRAVPRARRRAAPRDAGRPKRRAEPRRRGASPGSATKGKPTRCTRCWSSACRRAPSRRTRRQHLEALRRWQEDTRQPGLDAGARPPRSRRRCSKRCSIRPPPRSSERAARRLLWTEQALTLRRGADAAAEPVRARRDAWRRSGPSAPRRSRSWRSTCGRATPRARWPRSTTRTSVGITPPSLRAARGERRRRQRSGCLGRALPAVRVGGCGVGGVRHHARSRSGARCRVGRGARAVPGRAAARSAPRCRSASLLLGPRHGRGRAADPGAGAGAAPSRRARPSWALRYVLEAIRQAEALGDLPAARRTFAHAGALIKLSAARGLRRARHALGEPPALLHGRDRGRRR